MNRTGTVLFPLGLMTAALCCLNTAEAQNTVVATPQELTFNTQTGVTTPAQTILLSTTTGTANVSITARSSTNWLAVTPQSGSTPLLLTVSVGASAPASGVDVGFINITSGTTTQSIPVTLNANGNGVTSPISATPNSLSFVFAPGATAAASQTVALASSASSVSNFSATAITSNGGSWLSVTPPAGSLPGNLQVTVNPVSLVSNPGTFNAAVAINAPGTNGISIPVLVTIQGTPTLNVTPSQLSFGFQLGTSAPAAETLTLSSSTGANVAFIATAQTTSCGNWIVLNQNTGATPSTLSVQVNTSGLMAGTCSGQINISAPSASNPAVSIPVSLLVSTTPLILVPSTGPTFAYQIGGALPASQNVQITSSTSGQAVSITSAPKNGGPNFLEVSPATGTTPQSLTLSISPSVLASLGPGTYLETVTVSGTGAGNSPQTFDVTLTVSSNPTLIGSAPALNFNYQVGQTAPSNQTVTITSSGAPLNYQVAVNATSCPGFLSATPATGSTFGNQNQVIVSVHTGGLTPQVCSGNVTLTVPGSMAAPLIIPVTLNVSNNPLLGVSQGAISVTALAGAAPIVQSVSVTSTGASFAFSAVASTNPAGLTWLSVTPNNGNTPSNIQVTINPANLGAGVYTGSISVSSPGASVPAQTIPVTLTVVASTAVASPTSLTFTQAAGGTAPDSQSVQIAGVPTGSTIGVIPTVLSGTGWLTATAAGDTVTVAANGSQLAQGTYSGVVTVIVPGAGSSPLYIPVTLNVTGATSAITLSASSASFNVAAGSSATPGSQSIQVTSTATGTTVPFTATFVPSTGGNFLTVSPASGNTPGTLTLSVDSTVSSTLSAGTYTGNVEVSSGTGAIQTIKVTLVVSPAGTPVVFSVNNAASFQAGAVSPGEIVTIFGVGIGPATPATGTSFAPTPSGTVPTTLANVTVTFNNVPAPLIFVAAGQINAIVPYEVAGQTSVPVVVTNNGAVSATFTAPVVAVAPSIFSLTMNGSGQGAILNSDASINGSGNPAAAGTIISIFATGEGQIVPAGTTGCITGGTLPLPKPVASVSVTVGGQPAASIEYAGEAPDSVCGLLQINATLPSNLSSGPQPVILTIGTSSNTGQSITVAVK